MDFVLQHSAIPVSPNYLKLPESNGLKLMDNISHFWQWFRQGLASVVTSATEGKVEDDETKTIIIGYSAGKMMQNHSSNTEIDKIGHTGGYLAVQPAITEPAGSIKAMIAAYPTLDFKSPFFA